MKLGLEFPFVLFLDSVEDKVSDVADVDVRPIIPCNGWIGTTKFLEN